MRVKTHGKSSIRKSHMRHEILAFTYIISVSLFCSRFMLNFIKCSDRSYYMIVIQSNNLLREYKAIIYCEKEVIIIKNHTDNGSTVPLVNIEVNSASFKK